MPEWLIWLIGSGALALGEVVTLGFFLGPIAIAALVTAGAAAIGAPVPVQLVVFIVGTLASLLVLRPIARKHLKTPAKLQTGSAALVGRSAVVLERVDLEGGQVKLAGEVWSARAYEGAGTFDPGQRVQVVQIDGATAVVMTE